MEIETRASATRVYVLAPTDAAIAHVDARFAPQPDAEVGAAIDVPFGASPPIAAGTGDPAAAGGLAVHFAFRCDTENIGALVTDRADIAVSCQVVLEDRTGAALPHAPLRLYAEAGTFVDVPATPDAARAIYYLAPALITHYPADVAPTVDEAPLAVEGEDLIPGAKEQNPRDGLVTLLAVTRGDEAFTDVNGDGAWEAGEPFVDEGEPFLDVDDDGVYDPAVDIACCDSNGNGVVDGPDGSWSHDVWLGREAHILWTGPVAAGPGRSGIDGPTSIPAGGSATFHLDAVDDDGNPVAMLGDHDGISDRDDRAGRDPAGRDLARGPGRDDDRRPLPAAHLRRRNAGVPRHRGRRGPPVRVRHGRRPDQQPVRGGALVARGRDRRDAGRRVTARGAPGGGRQRGGGDLQLIGTRHQP